MFILGQRTQVTCSKDLMRNAFFILLFYLVVSCSEKKTNEDTSISNLQYTFLKDSGVVNPSIQGIWKSIGNGYYLEARRDSILLYSYTENFCYKEKNDYLEGLLNSESQFSLGLDTLSVYLTDYGQKTRNLQSKKDFVRMEGLPENCITFLEMTELDERELFDLYLETLSENYAFSKRRNLDWTSIYNTYKDSITFDEESLFEIMGKVATLTKDQHTKVIDKDGRKLQYRITPSALIVQEAFTEQSEITYLNDYFNLYFETNYKNISDSLLLGKGKKVVNGKLEWGSLNSSIGYLNIHSFAGFASSKIPRKQQIDSIDHHMREILNAFANKDAIIVDISFNFGGFDASGLTIASYFTDRPVLAYDQEVYSNGDFYREDQITIEPNDSLNYSGPVYVLMTDISRSAAESFAMMMGALPNVKLVGTRTLGTLSGMLGKSIGDFYTTISNQRLLSTDGQFYEAVGVKPDIELQVFKKKDVFQGHKTAVKDLMGIIGENNRNRNID